MDDEDDFSNRKVGMWQGEFSALGVAMQHGYDKPFILKGPQRNHDPRVGGLSPSSATNLKLYKLICWPARKERFFLFSGSNLQPIYIRFHICIFGNSTSRLFRADGGS